MPLKRYRVIVKQLCPSCARAKKDGSIVKDCKQCAFIKYNNVTKLRKFTDFIDRQYPDWVWFKVYEYRPEGAPGRLLATFKNWHKNYVNMDGKWTFMNETREVPTREQL